MQATGYATWTGTWQQGTGTIATATPTLAPAPYSYASRFDGAPGASPEELLAAAHAGCFNQALANNFGMRALTATSIRTAVTIAMGRDEQDRPAILGSHIVVVAAVPGATAAQLQECAARSSSNCSISKILRCEITFAAQLVD